jgi:hypothetical protein
MKKLSESLWSDIQKRSAGETKRKEDDVNLMDTGELVDYIEHNYILHQHINFSPGDDDIMIHIFSRDNHTTLFSLYNNNTGTTDAYISFTGDLKSSDYVLLRKLKNRYNLTFSIQFKIYKLLKINKHAPTNKDFLEMLDFILDNLSKKDDILIVKP